MKPDTLMAVDPALNHGGLALLGPKSKEILMTTAFDFSDLEDQTAKLQALWEYAPKKLQEWNPKILVIEGQFYKGNPRAYADVIQAKTVWLLAAFQVRLDATVFEMPPNEWQQELGLKQNANRELLAKAARAQFARICDLPDEGFTDDVISALWIGDCAKKLVWPKR